MSILVGYSRFKSKKGVDYCVANVVSDYPASAAGSVGQKIEQIFMPDDLYDYLQPSHIGKEIKLDYEISGNRAYLTGVKVVGAK